MVKLASIMLNNHTESMVYFDKALAINPNDEYALYPKVSFGERGQLFWH